MEINTNKNLPMEAQKKDLTVLLDNKVKETTDVKNAIDLLSTKTALEQKGTVEKLVEEKQEELRNDAEAKRIKAETDRIKEEVEKVKKEKEKELETLDKQISIRKKEVEQLKTESDKAQAFYDSNSEILKYIGVRNKKTLNVMKALMVPATLIFVIVQILLFPLTFCGVTVEAVVNIVGGICGTIKNNALKIVISVGIVLLIIAVVFLAYFYGGKLIANA